MWRLGVCPSMPAIRFFSFTNFYMQFFRSSLVAYLSLIGLLVFSFSRESLAQNTSELAIDRYEQMLLRSPTSETAFNQIRSAYENGEGLDALEERWATAQAGSDAKQASRYALLRAMLATARNRNDAAALHFAEAAKLNSEDYLVFLLKGNFELERGAKEAGIAALEMASTLNVPPFDLQPLYSKLAQSYAQMMQPEMALATWQRLAEAFPGDPQINEDVAEAMLSAGMPDAAIKQLADLLEQLDGKPQQAIRIELKLADMQMRQAGFESAINAFRDILKRLDTESWRYKDVAAKLELAYRRSGNIDGLEAYYEERLNRGVPDADAALRMAELMLDMGRSEEAIKCLELASQWAPDQQVIRYRIASLLLFSEQYDSARKILEELIAKNPQRWEYRELLGESWWVQHEVDELPGAVDKAVEAWKGLAPEGVMDINRINQLGDLFRYYGLSHQALHQYYRAIELEPASFDLRERIALYLISSGREERAWEALEGIPQEALSAQHYLRLASFYQRYSKTKEAMAAVEKGLAMEPANYRLGITRWQILVDSGEHETAITAFESLYESTESEIYREELEAAITRRMGRTEAWEKYLTAISHKYNTDATSVSARDMRILLRNAVENGNQILALQLIQRASDSLSQDFLFAKLVADYWNEYGMLDDKIAALDKLRELRPDRSPEWQRQAVLLYLDESRPEEAISRARELISMNPADAESYQLISRACRMADDIDAAEASLREAIRLSLNAHDYRLELAEFLVENKRYEAAMEEYFTALRKADNASQRRSLVPPMAQLAVSQGSLSSLLNRLENEFTTSDSSERALYLAEVFLWLEDDTLARQYLEAALTGRRDDPRIYDQLVDLSRAPSQSKSRVQYARQLSRLAPSFANDEKLAYCLLQDGQTRRALALLQVHSEELLKQPESWVSLYEQFEGAGQGEEFASILREIVLENDSSWMSLLGLAEFLVLRIEDEAAMETLWDIIRIDAQYLPPSSAAAMPSYIANRNATETVRRYWWSISVGHKSRRAFTQMLQARYQGDASQFTGFQPASLEQAQVTAAVYLAGLATVQGKADSFVEELLAYLDEIDSTPAGRVITLAHASAMGPLLDTIEYEAMHGDYDGDLFAFCHQALIDLLTANRDFRIDRLRIEPIADRIEQRIIEEEPQRTAEILVYKAQRYITTRNVDAARDVVLENWETFLASSPSVLVDALNLLKHVNLGNNHSELLSYLMLNFESVPASDRVALLQLMPEYLANLPDDLAKEERIALADAFVLQAITISDSDPRGVGMRLDLHNLMRTPFPETNLGKSAHGLLREVALIGRQNLQSLVIQRLHHLASSKHPESARANLALANIELYQNQNEKAHTYLEKAVSELDDPLLYILLASNSLAIAKPQDCLDALDRAEFRDTITVQAATVLRAKANILLNNLEEARVHVLTLVEQNVGNLPQFNLDNIVRQLGLQEIVEQMEMITTKQQIRTMNTRQTRTVFATLQKKQQNELSLSIASEILRDKPAHNGNTNQQEIRYDALRQLDRLGQLEQRAQTLARQLQYSPDSALLLGLLAESLYIMPQRSLTVAQGKQTIHFLDIVDRLVNLRSDNPVYEAWQVGELRRIRDFKRLAAYYRDKLDKSFIQGLQEQHQLLDSHLKSEEIDRLVSLVLEQPMPKREHFIYKDMRWQGSQLMRQMAQRLADSEYTQEASQILLKVLETVPLENSFDHREQLMHLYLEQGKEDEAWAVISPFFLMEPDDYIDPLWLRQTSHVRADRWFGSMQMQSHRRSNKMMDLLMSINGKPIMERLITASEGQLSKDNAIGLVYRNALLTQAYAAMGDSRAGEYLMQLMDSVQGLQPAFRDYYSDIIYKEVVPLCTDYLLQVPGCMEVCLQAIAIQEDIFEGSSGVFAVVPVEQRFELALMNGDDGAIAQATVNLLESLKQNHRGNLGFTETTRLFPIVDILLERGMLNEATSVLEFIQMSPQASKNTQVKGRMDVYEALIKPNRAALSADKFRLSHWVESELSADGSPQAYLNWEVLPGNLPGDASSTMAVALGTENTSIKPYALTVSMTDASAADEPADLGSQPIASSGRMALPTTSDSMGLQLSLSLAETPGSEIKSDSMVFQTAANLIANPGIMDTEAYQDGELAIDMSGWQFPPSMVRLRKGGPGLDGHYVELYTEYRDEAEFIGEAIPLEQGMGYQMSGWARASLNSTGSLGVQFLDADRKLISTRKFPVAAPDNGALWNHTEQLLQPELSKLRKSSTIPANAAYIRPIIYARGMVAWDGIQLQPYEPDALEALERKNRTLSILR